MSIMIGIGLFVGLILGLTGAGGALIAIPLFINFLHLPMEEATFYSLMVVLLSSLLNYFFQPLKADRKLVLSIWIFSFIGSYGAFLIKPHISDLMTALLLAAVSLFGVWSVWRKSFFSDSKKIKGRFWGKSVLWGVFFGALTTLTGLGGGALVVPLLISQFYFSYEEAVPSSLLLIFLISTLSFGIQMTQKEFMLGWSDIVALIIGIGLSIFISKKVSQKMSKETFDSLRKVVFTIVVFYSLISIGVNVYK